MESFKLKGIANQDALAGQAACADMIIPTITPNNPSALPNISITRIFTKREEFWASDNAQLLPIIPTHKLVREKSSKDFSKCKNNTKMYISHKLRCM